MLSYRRKRLNLMKRKSTALFTAAVSAWASSMKWKISSFDFSTSAPMLTVFTKSLTTIFRMNECWT